MFQFVVVMATLAPDLANPAVQRGSALCPESEIDAMQYPAKVLGLSDWELTYPEKCKDHTPCQVEPKQLSTFSNKYFYTHADGVVRFCSPWVGAHTQHATDTRSELDQGKKSFHIGEGKHTLAAHVKVMHVPNVKADSKVCIGQIHGDGKVKGEYAMIVKLEYQRVDANSGKIGAAVKNNNVKDPKGKELDFGEVKLGDSITYSIELDGTELSITVNGKKAPPYSYAFLPSDIKKGNFFFKAGNYCSPAGKGNDDTDGCIVDFIGPIKTSHTSKEETVVV